MTLSYYPPRAFQGRRRRRQGLRSYLGQAPASDIPVVRHETVAAPTITHAQQGRKLLKLGLGAMMLIGGSDKVLGGSKSWSKYLSGWVRGMSPVSSEQTIQAIGGLEILGGLIMLANPYLGGRMLSTMMLAAIVNLLQTGHHWDIIIRDLGLMFAGLGLSEIALDNPSL